MTDDEFLKEYINRMHSIETKMEATIEEMVKTRVAIAELEPKLPPPAMPRLKFKRGKHN